MSTYDIFTQVDLDDVLNCVSPCEEKDFLLEILESLDVHNINDALREYYGSQNRDKIPDFVDAEKL
nr:MAG TPA: hypothetical protein [Caudoviricetes sp.]